VYSLVYLSSATRLLSRAELAGLLKAARVKNERLGVTGLLVYRGGTFMQVLEGEEAVVRGLFETIKRDARHTGVIELHAGESERTFGKWSMAFRKLDARSEELPEGFSDFLDQPGTAGPFQGKPARVVSLLRLFRDDMGAGA
jgi:hypothetical protein